MSRFQAGLSGVSFRSKDCRLLGGFYKAAGDTPRPTAILLHGLPGIEQHLHIAYALQDLGWNCLDFHFRGCCRTCARPADQPSRRRSQLQHLPALASAYGDGVASEPASG